MVFYHHCGDVGEAGACYNLFIIVPRILLDKLCGNLFRDFTTFALLKQKVITSK